MRLYLLIGMKLYKLVGMKLFELVQIIWNKNVRMNPN